MSRDNVVRRVSIYVNGQEVENSLRGIDGAVVHLRNQLRALDLSTQEGREQSVLLSQEYRRARQVQEDYRQELSLTNRELQNTNFLSGGLRGTLTGIWDSLVSGDLEGAKEGISDLTSGMSGLVKSATAFIATPIGAAIAVLATIAAGTKALFDYNVELNKMNSELRALGVNTSEISKVRDEIKATADIFDKEFSEIAQKADSLAETFKISISEANKMIAEGLADGGAQNNEFLDSLGEYDEFFAKAGYSAKGFIDIVNTGYDLGIYTDKLPDALKEADLALKENTKATRDALVNAFGASFSDEVLNKVKTGEFTTKQALEAISQKAKESNLSQQQYAQLTADVFKGAGEDAGGAQKIFEALGQSAKRELDETAKASLKLVEANERLNKAQAELFEIKNFGDVWTNIKIIAIDALAGVIDFFVDIKKEIQPLIDLIGISLAGSFNVLKLIFSSVLDYISGTFRSVFSAIGGILKGLVKLLSGDFKGAWKSLTEGMFNAVNHLANVFVRLRNNIIDFLKGVVENAGPLLKALGLDVTALQKKLEGLKGKEFEIKGKVKVDEPKLSTPKTTPSFGSGGGGATADALKAEQKARADAAAKQKATEEKAAKESYDRAKALADAKANLAKAQLDSYILGLRSNIDKEKALTPEILANEINRLKQIADKQIEFNNDELARKIAGLEEKAKLEGTSLELLNLQKEALTVEYETKNQEIQLGFLQSTDTLKKQYEEEQKALKAEQLALDNELALAEAETKAEADKLKQEQDYQSELKRYAKLYADKKITLEEYERFKNHAKEKQDELDKVRELQQLNGTLGGMNQLANAVGELFGQSKELALVQAGINGAMAITSILAQYPKFDGGFAMYAAIASATITTAAQVKEITKAKPPKKPKFFYGGATGDYPALGFDEYGPVTGYVHKNEYVVPEVLTQDPTVAPIVQWIEQKRQQKLKGYVEGGETSQGALSSSTAPSLPIDYNAALVTALNMLNSILTAGITANVFLGYDHITKIKEMMDELTQSNNNGKVG